MREWFSALVCFSSLATKSLGCIKGIHNAYLNCIDLEKIEYLSYFTLQ